MFSCGLAQKVRLRWLQNYQHKHRSLPPARSIRKPRNRQLLRKKGRLPKTMKRNFHQQPSAIWPSNLHVRELSTSVAAVPFFPSQEVKLCRFSTLYLCQPSQQRPARDILLLLTLISLSLYLKENLHSSWRLSRLQCFNRSSKPFHQF